MFEPVGAVGRLAWLVLLVDCEPGEVEHCCCVECEDAVNIERPHLDRDQRDCFVEQVDYV